MRHTAVRDLDLPVKRLALCWSLSVAIGFAFGAPAAAQPLAVGEGSDPDAEYNRTIERAVERFRERDFERARKLFAAAHDLNPSARTLRGLGLTDFESGRYARAIRELEAALADKRKPLDPQQRGEVHAVLAHARGFVGTMEVHVTPEDAQLTIDDATLTEKKLQLDIGTYVVRASAPGYIGSEQHVMVQPGQLAIAKFELEPLRADPGTDAPVESYDDTQQTAAWIIGGVGMAGVVVGTIFGVRSIVKHNESDDYCGDDSTCSDIKGVRAMDDARAAGDVSTVGFIAGGLALGVATVLLLTAPNPDAYPTETDRPIAVRVGPGAIRIDGVF